MSGPLSGLRVVDCTHGIAGTRAGGLFADFGADVIRVEPPGGDPFRDCLAVPYSVFDRGKRSIILDLRDEVQRETLLDLLVPADVFLQSWRPGVAGRLGVGWEAVHARAAGLVYCSISGFGAQSRHRELPGHEALVHAVVGTTGEQVGHRDGPIYEGLPFASIGAAYLAVMGVLAALHRRERDGLGRHVETSLLDGALAYLSMTWGDSDDASVAPPVVPGSIRLVARTFRCADDEYLGIHTGAVGAFGRFIRVLGLDDRIPCAPDGTDMQVPLTREQAWIVSEEIPKVMLTRPRAAWLDLLSAADVCAIPALRPGEVLDEPQVRHNRLVIQVDDPVLGPVEQIAPPVVFPACPAQVRGPAPRPGEHTAEVLAGRGWADQGFRAMPPQQPAPLLQAAPEADRPLLDGLRILDLGAYYAGPYSSRLLADLGADVIKLETLLGDQLRGIARPFRSAQAGKRGIALDLKDAEIAPILRRLLEWADVVCHNMRPGAAERLGVGYEQVRAVNPQAVYLYAPGWGSTGPDRSRQSFAPMLSGYVGASHEVAGRYNDPLFPVGNEDPGNGLLGAVAILTALLRRARTDQGMTNEGMTNEGMYVENSQLGATLAHMAHVVRQPDGTVLGAMRLDPLQMGTSALDRLYQTADGWLCLVATGDAEVARLGGVLGVDLLADPRFATQVARHDHDDDLSELLADTFSTRNTGAWMRALDAAGVAAVVPVAQNNSQAFHRDPENHRSGRVMELTDPVHGRIRELAQLIRVSDAAVAPHRPAPGHGEHTDEVLGTLGVDPARISALRARGVIR